MSKKRKLKIGLLTLPWWLILNLTETHRIQFLVKVFNKNHDIIANILVFFQHFLQIDSYIRILLHYRQADFIQSTFLQSTCSYFRLLKIFVRFLLLFSTYKTRNMLEFIFEIKVPDIRIDFQWRVEIQFTIQFPGCHSPRQPPEGRKPRLRRWVGKSPASSTCPEIPQSAWWGWPSPGQLRK